MIYTFYVVCEEGMDRPLVWHQPPPPERGKPRKVYRVEVPLPDVTRVDGIIRLGPDAVQILAEHAPVELCGEIWMSSKTGRMESCRLPKNHLEKDHSED
jgi:hypothetical protein